MKAPQSLPEDWLPHVGVVRDNISLRVRHEHWLEAAFLYEDGDERDAVNVTLLAASGAPFSTVDQIARRLLTAVTVFGRSKQPDNQFVGDHDTAQLTGPASDNGRGHVRPYGMSATRRTQPCENWRTHDG